MRVQFKAKLARMSDEELYELIGSKMDDLAALTDFELQQYSASTVSPTTVAKIRIPRGSIVG